MSDPSPRYVPVHSELASSVFDTRDETDPRFCGWRWWLNLLHRQEWLPYLVAGTVPGREAYWGDYSAAAAYLDGWDMASEVQRTERDDVVWLRFVQLEGDDDAYVLEGGTVPEARAITLARCADGTWRVWSLGPGNIDDLLEVNRW